ncbi:MAG: hypothetical protein LAP87_23800 [Acidobacteriia bacterium]|nr:hypothetical protein [Terriglobia bacterium]
MDLDVAERFEPIQAILLTAAQEIAKTQAAMTVVVQSQARLQEMIGSLTESVSRYVETSDARLTRIEENLDGLIRAITAEHENGRQKN